MNNKHVVVIGGGASGMMAAIMAAMEGAKVNLIERNDRVGKKILSTGNGKCNFTHEVITSEDYYGSVGEHVQEYLDQFSKEDTLHFFESIGMMWKNKNGYYYPYSEQAATVLDMLRMELKRLQVKISCETKIDDIRITDKDGKRQFCVCSSGKQVAVADALIVTGGGLAAPSTGSDGTTYELVKKLGVKMIEAHPALTKLTCSDSFCKALSGVRSEAVITLLENEKVVATEKGEIQFADYGISGIPVFQLSRIVTKTDYKKGDNPFTCMLDLFPDFSQKDLFDGFMNKLNHYGSLRGEDFLEGFLNKKLAGVLGKLAGIKYAEPVSQKDYSKLEKLAYYCKNFMFHIDGYKGFDAAQTTAGGVSYEAITDRLESCRHKGLYFAGELLDIDGKCGGFNLQWAWISGAIAGRNAAKLEA